MPVGALGTARRYSAMTVGEFAAAFELGAEVAAKAARVDTARVAPTIDNVLIMIVTSG